MPLSTFSYSLCSYIAGLIKWRIFAIVYCISNILILALYFVCEAVLLFTLATGRRLAELELVLLLVQVCVPMSIAVHMYVMVCSVIGVCVCMSVWCVLCAFCVYMHTYLCMNVCSALCVYECVQVTYACHVSI